MMLIYIIIIMFKKCIHNHKLYNKDCDGKGICQHNRVRSRCKECNNSNFYEHSRKKSRCLQCSKTIKKNLCSHNRQKAFCKECGGSQICSHNRQKQLCRECNKPIICIHGVINCKECILANSPELKLLNIIRELKKNNISNDLNISINIIKNKYNICEHNNIKTNCYTCQNNFITSMLN